MVSVNPTCDSPEGRIAEKTTQGSMPAWVLCLLAVSPVLIAAAERTDPLSPAQGWDLVPEILQRIDVPQFPSRQFDVTHYGAVGDGARDCYQAFRNAIEACHSAGGGSVIVPSGTYFMRGPIHLKSNINLHLQKAHIRFSATPADFLIGDVKGCVLTSWEGTRLYNYSPAVYAYDAENIAITGTGVLDHQGAETWKPWRKKQKPDQQRSRTWNNEGTPLSERVMGAGHYLRPHLLQFYKCRNILIESVTFQDSGFWVIHQVFGRNITIRNIQFKDCHNLNNDGIDIEFCRDVHIHHIDFDNGDDNIALKAGRDREGLALAAAGWHTQYIVVQNVNLKGHNGFCIGSEMSGGVYDVFAENIGSVGDVAKGLLIKTNRDRGGEVARIHMRNIELAKTTGNAFEMTTDYKGQNTHNRIPSLHDVTLENITIHESKGTAILLAGLAEQPIKNITLRNVTFHKVREATQISHASNLIFEDVRIESVTGPVVRKP